MANPQCPSVHIWSGSEHRCIRAEGHDGLCWGPAQKGDGTFTRAEWHSEGGKFKSHHQYATIYPTNAQRRTP